MPPSTPARRAALAAVAALALAAGCAPREPEGCPGRTFARLRLAGPLVSGACLADPGGGWEVPASYPEDPNPDDAVVPTILGTFALDEGSGETLFCSGHRLAAPLRGPRDGDHVRLEVTLQGAVLAACASTCEPLTTVVLDGTLTGTAGGGATGFEGTLTETQHDAPPASDGSDACAPCQLPCTTIYSLGVAGQEGG
ncbi:MAG: hypothetical protein QM767_25265 [Anaeromyxobacter sp.]